jgi:hypothetical protein
VRGRLIGPECLGAVLGEPPPGTAPAAPGRPRGTLLGISGFAGIVLLTILPWSRFGDSSHPFGAWSRHWSLLALLAALAGLGLALAASRLPALRTVEPVAAVMLAIVAVAAAVLHAIHPPPLSVATPVPWLAGALGCLALWAAVMRAIGAAQRPVLE